MAKKKDKTKEKAVKAQEAKASENDAFVALQEQFDALQKERDDLFENQQRLKADYANYQKRVPKQVADSVNYEKEKILKSFLPVLDSFGHSLNSSESAEDVAAVLKGVRIVYEQMLDALTGHGVTQIEAQGQPFDPARHEAMMRQEDPEQEDNVVLQEFQKGYCLGERVLRPCKVIVNKLPVEPEPADEPDDVQDSEDVSETEEV